MGSDKLTKKLGKFIAFGTLASASLAYATDTMKTAQPPVQEQVNKAKLEAKVEKPRKSRKAKPATEKAPEVTPTK